MGPAIRALIAVLALPGAMAAHADGASAGSAAPRDRGLLAAESAVEQEIRGGEADLYRLRLSAGEYARAVVEQRGIDLVLALYTPEEEKVVEVDGPGGAVGPEPVSIVAERSGDYRLEVRSPNA